MVMVQVYAAVTPKDAETQLLAALREEFTRRGATLFETSGKPVKRAFQKLSREGRRLDFDLAGERMQIEIYAWKKGDRTVAMTLQHAASDAAHAQKVYPVVTGTIE